MSDVTVSVTESTTSVTVSEQSVAVAITESPTVVSTATVGLQGIPGAQGVGYSGITSTSSITIGSGLKTWTISDNGAFVTGMRIRAIHTDTPGYYMEGPATYVSSGTLIITVDKYAGSGTHNAWVFTVAGEIGQTGSTGASGVISVTAPITNTGTSSSAILGLDQTALSITRSQVSNFSSGTVASATIAGTASYSTTSGTAVSISGSITKSQVSDFTSGTVAYATVSGSATNASTALTAGTASYATTSGTSVSISGSITKSQVSDFTSGTVASATNATSAGTAQQAGTAVYSTSSGSALNAGTAVSLSGSITKSQVSDFTSGTVAVATNASTATYATTSGTASYSTTSGTAVYATNSATAVNVSGSAITRSQISDFTSGTVVAVSGSAITRSQISDFTSGTVASATIAGTATYATTSGTATYSTTSGTAVSISGSITKSQVSDFTSGTVANISGTVAATQVTGTAIVVGSSALVPTGGTAGQVLSKVDSTNYNLTWTTPSSGGGGSGFTGIGTAVTSIGGRFATSAASVTPYDFKLIGGTAQTTSSTADITAGTTYLSGQYADAPNTTSSNVYGGDLYIDGGSVNAPNATISYNGSVKIGNYSRSIYLSVLQGSGGQTYLGSNGETLQIGSTASNANTIYLNSSVQQNVSQTAFTTYLGINGGAGQTFTGRFGYNNTGTAILQIGSQNGGAQVTIGSTANSWNFLQGVTFMPSTINAISTTGTAVYTALTGGIITSTPGSAITITLPTGNAITTGITSAPQGGGFDWSLINLSASFAATLGTAANHTISGASAVAASTSGRFRTRFTSSNTWVTYRIS